MVDHHLAGIPSQTASSPCQTAAHPYRRPLESPVWSASAIQSNEWRMTCFDCDGGRKTKNRKTTKVVE
ncbi:hypothetical protein GCK72_017686 [Caenorhabditis remanei]|uniref:Uncharacterized protein n=1 Tax=Caenorhabditis remanei TaxID=31234 RepID=A0A6A5G968_CAERE|nr:hypothetical protein GCK72_017686 [Caenorhabditis remanei]KAF1751132.1 hypothetical protein GCK72_017686 [Caenorhabditis remanei]